MEERKDEDATVNFGIAAEEGCVDSGRQAAAGWRTQRPSFFRRGRRVLGGGGGGGDKEQRAINTSGEDKKERHTMLYSLLPENPLRFLIFRLRLS